MKPQQELRLALRPALLLGAAILALLAALVLKGALLPLPSLPAASSASFDAVRAAARLQAILGDQRPHTVDSEAGDLVRARLAAQMRAVGLTPRTDDGFSCNGSPTLRALSCARVRNLVATIGPRRGRHALLVSHYDSTPVGPGAADDGIGVATMLEIADRLRGRPLARPVSFLFNEGEERGLIGARAFVERDPLRDSIFAAINLESRGTTGPAVMFETSRPSGAAIAYFARSAPNPVANSLTTDLYRLIPNTTDVDVLAERPWTILNFAVIGEESRYHSARDRIEALDRRSLQHMGEQAMAATLEIANGEGAAVDGGDPLYMDMAGRALLLLPFLAGAVLLFALLAWFAVVVWRRRAWGRPLLAIVSAMLGSAAIAWLGESLVAFARGGGDYWRAHPWVIEVAVYGSALGAALAAFATIAPRDPTAREKLRPAFWLAFLLTGAAIMTLAPGGIVFFLLPPLVCAAGFLLGRRFARAETFAALAAAGILLLTFGPALELFEELMIAGPHWIFAPLAAAILLPWVIELGPLARRLPKWLLLAAAGDAILLPWAAAALVPAYSVGRPQHQVIEFAWDADRREGRWGIYNDGARPRQPGAWTRGELPHSARPRWVQPGPALSAAAPSLALVSRREANKGAILRLRLGTAGAESVTIFAPAEARLIAGGMNGALRRFGQGDGRFALRCFGRACDGAFVELHLARAGPIELELVGVRPGLPRAAAALLAARPREAAPQYSPDATIAVRRILVP